jgi:hypothetical protein
LDAEAGEIFPHGDKESFRVGHTLNVAESEGMRLVLKVR